MNHRRLVPIIAVLGVALVATGLPAAGQVADDQFAIGYGDTVADGAPGAGRRQHRDRRGAGRLHVRR